ncbi:MAG: hypothetical protein H7249_13645 [Chitinophagaceae bacterium]|nr:hypothetical protein [Oligoflexus sp.]
MKKSVRFAGICLIALAVLDLIWFGATKSYLNSDVFFKKINNEKLQFSATDGYSPWPGYFLFQDFTFRGLSKESTYEVKAKTVSFRFNVLNLARHHVSINGLNANDVTISVVDSPENAAIQKDTEKNKKDKKAGDKDKDESADQDKDGKKKELWVTEFSGAEFDNVKEVALGKWVWTGKASLNASFTTDNHKHFAIERFEADSTDLAVVNSAVKFVTISQANIKIGLDEISLDNKDWKTILPKIDSDWKIKGKLDRVESLEPYTKNLDWFALTGSPLTMDGDFGIKDGKFKNDSHLKFAAETLHIDLLNQTIYGPATFEWNVKKTNHVELKFGEYTLNKGRDGSGKGFALVLDTPDKRIVPDWKDWDAHVFIPPTVLHRVQFLQQYIPASLPLILEKGEGTLQGELHASSAIERSKGLLELKIKNLQAVYKKDLRFVGSAVSKMKITRLDPKKGYVDLADTGIDITNLSFLDKKDWKGSLHLTNTHVKFNKPNELKSDVDLKGDNLQPVLAFLVKDKSFPQFLMKAFDLKNPKVDFKIIATEHTFYVRDFEAKAGDLSMKGWFDKKVQNAKARFLVEYAGLAGGYGFDDDKSQWNISNAREWFAGEQKTSL